MECQCSILQDYLELSLAGKQTFNSPTFPTVLIGHIIQQSLFVQKPKTAFSILSGKTDKGSRSELGSGSGSDLRSDPGLRG